MVREVEVKGTPSERVPRKMGAPAADPRKVMICWRCGRSGHTGTDCKHPNPDRNNDSSVSFRQSTMGRNWAARGIDVVPRFTLLNGSRVGKATTLFGDELDAFNKVQAYLKREKGSRGGEAEVKRGSEDRKRGTPDHRDRRDFKKSRQSGDDPLSLPSTLNSLRESSRDTHDEDVDEAADACRDPAAAAPPPCARRRSAPA